MLVTHKSNGLVSVITAAGILVWNSEPDYALKAIIACGFNEQQAEFALSDRGLADAATFKTTLASCFANTLERLDSEVEALAASTGEGRADLDAKIHSVNELLRATQEQLAEQQRQQQIRDEIRYLEESLFNPRRIEQVEEQLGSRFTRNDAINLLYNTPNGQRLIELKRELANGTT